MLQLSTFYAAPERIETTPSNDRTKVMNENETTKGIAGFR